jgi:hypothetical protein
MMSGLRVQGSVECSDMMGLVWLQQSIRVICFEARE